MLHMIRVKDYEELSKKAAMMLGAQVLVKPDSVLCLPTGTTPIGMYAQLVAAYRRRELDFSRVRIFTLDEYLGLPGTHKQSYRYFMQQHLYSEINIPEENTFNPDGTTQDLAKTCEEFDEQIRRLGGIDLVFLGLGHNCHIGFNEPADQFTVETHPVDLSESTVKANSRFFDNPDEVPRWAITMGLGSIMAARRVVVIVSGEDKADALHRSFFGPVTPQTPASILQLHPDVTVICDEAAAGV